MCRTLTGELILLTVLTSLTLRLFRVSTTRRVRPRAPRRHPGDSSLSGRPERLEPRCLLSGAAAGSGLEKFESREAIRDFVLDQLHTRWAEVFGTHGQYIDHGCDIGLPWNGPAAGIVSQVRTAIDSALSASRWFCPRPTLDIDALQTDALATAADGLRSTVDHSGTNNQIEGVEEADLVQTDGRFLYLLSGRELVIVDTAASGELNVASRTRLDGAPIVQFLHGDRLTVVSRTAEDPGLVYPAWVSNVMIAADWFPSPRSRLTVSVFDISDRSHPEPIHETILDGDLVQARAVGDQDYIAVRNAIAWTGWYDDWLTPQVTRTESESTVHGHSVTVVDYSYETWDAYRDRLLAGPDLVDYVLPGVYHAAASPDSEPVRIGLLSDLDDIVRPNVSDPANLVTVIQLDVGAAEPRLVDTETVFTSYGNHVFATAEHLYITSYSYETGTGTGTDIAQLSLLADSVEITATGHVAGIVLNQFSMDEFSGHFRIATTTSGWRGDRWIQSNALFVLDTAGPTLDVVGQLTDLAHGETLMSARFLGDRAYVVTFLQVDPLFVIDLSDPTAPTVAGELKIPGFSQYLHPIGNDQLIGIGREARDGRWWWGGLQVSVFDVSEATPEVLSQLLVTSAGDWSGVVDGTGQFDHHAVSYFPESRILSLPVRQGPNWWSWFDSDDAPTRFQPYALKVLRIDADGTLHLLGEIAHEHPVVRSLRIEDRLYSISREHRWRPHGPADHLTIKVHRLDDPTQLLDELSLVNSERAVYQPPVAVPVGRRPIGHAAGTASSLLSLPQESPSRSVAAVLLDGHETSNGVASRLLPLVTAQRDHASCLRCLPSSGLVNRAIVGGTRMPATTASMGDLLAESEFDDLWSDLGAQLRSPFEPLADVFGLRDEAVFNNDSPAARLHRRPAVVATPRDDSSAEAIEPEAKSPDADAPAPNPSADDEPAATPPA
jgi:hypothetical protein